MDRKVLFFVLSLACVSVAASTSWVSRPTSWSPIERKAFRFSPDQTYVYEYRGRLVNGIPKLADQYAGLEIEADLLLQPIDGKQVVMKLDDIKIDQIHAKLDQHYEESADQLLHDDANTPNRDSKKSIYDEPEADDESTIDRELLIEYTKELSKPIKFLYVNGKVERFEAESNDQEWSINMKKSILALFQLDLVPTKIIKAQQVWRDINEVNGVKKEEQQLQQDITTIVDPATGRRVSGQYTPESVIAAGELPLVYPVYEEGFGGICETEYQVDSNENPSLNHHQQQQTNNKQWESDKFVGIANVLNVTKTINFKNCLTDPSVSYDGHKFQSASEQSTLWGSLVNKPTQPLAGYYPVPEELKAKYSRLSAASTEKSTAEETSSPVERYAFVKYNISQWQQPGASNGEKLSLIESVFAEGKIKYRAQGDELISVSHQYLKLVTVKKQQQRIESPKNTVVYETIQSELKSSKQKYYESVMRFANSRSSFAGHQQQHQQQQAAFNKQQMPEFAQSASWYSLVANILSGNKKNGQKDSMEPEQMAASVAQLYDSLATDVLTEDLEQSKKAGEKVVQIVNLISLMPKYKLIELYEQLASGAEHRHQQQRKDVTLKARIVRKLFLDSLPLSGSKNAIALIAELIESQRCTVSEAKEMVEAVPANLRFPDTEIIDAFIRVAQNAGVRKQRQLFASCSLACAKMIKNAYEQTKTESYKSTTLRQQLPQHLADDLAASIIATEADPRQQQQQRSSKTTIEQQSSSMMNADDDQDDDEKELDDEQLVRYIKYYKQMLEKSTQYYEKVIYLETLAHMGVPQVLPILEPYVSGRLSLQQCLGSATSHHLAAPLTSQQLARRQQWNYRNAFQRWTETQQEQEQEFDQQQQQEQFKNRQQGKQQQLSSMNKKSSIVGDAEWTEEIGMDAEECNHMRSVAIYALAHIAREHPSLVLPLVKPVFENVYEPYQIRIAAFTGALLAQADEPTLERWATQMWREPSQEVVSFVTGSLVTLANMTSPQLQSLSTAARKACESMPQQYVDDWRRSWMTGTDHYNGETKTTLSTFAELIKSNVSMVPRAGYVEMMRTGGPNGEHQEQIFQIGFAAKGIENVLRDFVGIEEDRDEHEYATKRGADQDDDDSILSLVFDNLFQGVDEISQWWNEIREAYEIDTTKTDADEYKQRQSSFYKQRQQQQMLKGKLAAGASVQATKAGASLKEKLSSQYTRQEQQQWIYGKRRTSEEPKLALFAKVFGSTSYYALDKKQMQQVLNGADAYLLDMAKDLMSGHKTVHYVKMMMPASMWHMTPSQLGLPIIVTHREPLLVSFAIQGQQQQQQQQRDQDIKQSTMQLSTIVHPKIMHSTVRFMFAVDCVSRQAYGVTTKKAHQLSVPFEASVEYSRAKQLVSVAVAPKVNKQQIVQSIETAKTFIGEVRLAHNVERNWLGQSRVIRAVSAEQSPLKLRFDSSKQQDSSSVERRRHQNPLGLDVQVDIVTDDTDFDWSFDMSQADQHRKGGPMAQWLHVIDALATRPCKHQEIRVQLKSDDSPSKQPVYRFDFDLTTKQLKETTEKLEGDDAKRPFGRRTATVTKQAIREQHDKQTWERALDQIESSEFTGRTRIPEFEQVQFEKVSPLRRNVILEKGADKICVSIQKIDVCPVGSFAFTASTSQQTSSLVGFRCFDKRTPTGEQLLVRYIDQQQQIEKTKSQLLSQKQQLIIDSIISQNGSQKSHMRTSMPYVDAQTMDYLHSQQQQQSSFERQDMRQPIEMARSCITTVY